MSQHDYDIANGSGSVFRADINAVLDAIADLNAGATAPATTFANMWWYDSTNGVLKRRNPGNTTWLTNEWPGGSLGTTVGDLLEVFRGRTTTNNVDELRIEHYRENAAAGWNNASIRIRRVVDGAEQHALKLRGASAGDDFNFSTKGVTVGTPTGGTKGVGTINAQAVYDDNVLLSPYVFEQALTGMIDFTTLDSKVPDKVDPDSGAVNVQVHVPARMFSARIGSIHDPLDIDKYAQHWKDKGHLTSLVNPDTARDGKDLTLGEWVQRLVETVEIQAVHIDELNQRLKTLEANSTP